MHILLQAFAIGLVGGMVPGSILTILLVSVVKGGFSSGLRAFIWCVIAEVSVVCVLLAALFSLSMPEELFSYIGLIGAMVLWYLARKILSLGGISQPVSGSATFSRKEIFILSATNAPLYIFWVTVCAPLIFQLSRGWNPFVSASAFMASFEAGWMLSTFAILLAFVKARRYIAEPGVMKRVYAAAAALMFLFGLRAAYSSLVDILR
jgi:threonine/homoserine/homoserine lactone efflux protein